MLLHRAMCTQLPTPCAAYTCVSTNYIGGRGIISAGGPALPAFQRGISIADADDNRDADACDDERFSLNVYK